MAAPALTAASSLAVLAIGGAANLAASNNPLKSKTWLPRGGFIGRVNGHGGGTAVATPVAPPVVHPATEPAPTARPTTSPSKKIHPIGGRTDKPSPPSPFGRFPKHRPGKLPGPPTPYDPATSP